MDASHPQTPRVVVIGQGYVGLPLAIAAVDAGFDVVGYDVDINRTKALADGRSFTVDVPSAKVRAALDCEDAWIGVATQDDGFDWREIR